MSFKEDQSEWRVEGCWEGDNYKKVVRRVEDGFQFCSDLYRLVQERAEIEMKYAHKLQAWSSKWKDFIDKGSEYGTAKEVLLHSLLEAEALSEVYEGIRGKLQTVQNEVKRWRGECYKKQVVGSCKEAKAYEEEFKKAQKQWTRLLGKMHKYLKERDAVEKAVKSLQASASLDEQDKKVQEKLEKCLNEQDILEGKMEKVQKELKLYRSIYIGDMEEIYERTQGFEGKRLQFIKETLTSLHSSLDVSQNDQIPMIYVQWRRKIECLEPSADLAWWSRTHQAYPSENTKMPFEEKPVQKANNLSKVRVQSTQPPATDKMQDYDKTLNPFGSDDEFSLDSSSAEHPTSEAPLDTEPFTVLPPNHPSHTTNRKPGHTTLSSTHTPPNLPPAVPSVHDFTPDSIATDAPQDASMTTSEATVTGPNHPSTEPPNDPPNDPPNHPPNEPPTDPPTIYSVPPQADEAFDASNQNSTSTNNERKSIYSGGNADGYKADLNPFGDSSDSP